MASINHVGSFKEKKMWEVLKMWQMIRMKKIDMTITLSFLYSGFEWSSREVMIDFNIVFCTLALRLQGNSFIVDYYDYVDADVVLDLEMIVVQLIMMMMGWTPLDSGKPNYPEEECRIDKNKEQFILCFHYTQSFLCGLKGEGTFSRSNKSESVVLATIWVNWIQHIFGQKDNCNMALLLLWIFCQLFKNYIFEVKTKERKHNNEKVAFRSLIIVEWWYNGDFKLGIFFYELQMLTLLSFTLCVP